MKFTSFACALLIFCSAQSQITLTNADMPGVGFSNAIAKDTPVTAINYGSKGANQVYDFSALTATKRDTVKYLALTNTQQTNFPSATVAVTADGSTFLFTNSTSSIYDIEGLQGQLGGSTNYANFSPVEDVFHFPTQYGGTFSGTWGFQNTVPGSAVGQPSVNQVRITVTDNFNDTIDGWGKTVTPIGAYKSLREKRIDFKETLLEYNLCGICGWSTYSDVIDTAISYNYLAKETKGAVVSFDIDSVGDLLDAKYSLIPPAAPVPHFSSTGGGGGLVNFTDSTDGYPTTYSWNFGDGSPTSPAQNPNHTYAANGAYYVCETVTNAGGSNTFCDSVYINGLFLAAPSIPTEPVNIYPNPANDYVIIALGSIDEFKSNSVDVEIYNTIGERVKSVQAVDTAKPVNISIAQLSSGFYFVTLVDVNGSRKTLGKFAK